MVKKKTHVWLGVSTTLFLSKMVFNAGIGLMILQALIASIASTFPDIDVRLRHRRTLHNLFALVLSSITAYILLVFLDLPWTLVYAWIIGYGLHLATDLLTAGGVALLYPASKHMYRLTSRTYDDPTLNIPLVLLSLSLLAYTGYMLAPEWVFAKIHEIYYYVREIIDFISEIVSKLIK